MLTTPVCQGNSITTMSKWDELERAQLQIDEIRRKLFILSTPSINSIDIVMREVNCESNQEFNTNRRNSEIVYNCVSSEEEIEAWTKNDKLHDKSSPLDIHIIMTPSKNIQIKI